jgi:hypothetical protein
MVKEMDKTKKFCSVRKYARKHVWGVRIPRISYK